MDTQGYINKEVEKVARSEAEMKEAYIKEYLRLTGAKIEDLELVVDQTEMLTGKVKYYLQPKGTK